MFLEIYISSLFLSKVNPNYRFEIGSAQYCLRLHFLHIEPFQTLSN